MMADRLTQLQDCYDQVQTYHSQSCKLTLISSAQLATQFYASIRYISTHHSTSTLTPPPQAPPTPNSTSQTSKTQPTSTATNNISANHQPQPTQSTQSQEHQPTAPASQEPSDTTISALFPEQRPDTPTTFAAAQRELAHDLILKTKQIEYIISILPGVENSKEKQEERIKELNEELRAAMEERREAEGLREEWVRRVEGVVGGVRR